MLLFTANFSFAAKTTQEQTHRSKNSIQKNKKSLEPPENISLTKKDKRNMKARKDSKRILNTYTLKLK